MKPKNKIVWITQTAMFIALVVIMQVVTKAIPNPAGQFVTGSLVNFVTILAVLLGGLVSGIAVAALTPWFAFLLGIGPTFIQMVPCIMVGNIVLVLLWYFIAGKTEKIMPKYIIATVVAALGKFAVLYFLVVKFVIGVLQVIPAQQAPVVSKMFSYPQLITAIIGGIFAVIIAPILKKALKASKQYK